MAQTSQAFVEKEPILIRDATIEDGETLARFMQIQGKETENLDLELDDVLRGTLSLLKRPSFGRYFVAY